MKREQLILQALSDTQLDHARKLLDKEAKRRSVPPPPRKASGTMRRVTEEAPAQRRKAG